MKTLIILSLLFSLEAKAGMVEAIQHLKERSRAVEVFDKFGKPDEFYRSTEDANRVAFLYIIGDMQCGLEFERGIMYSNRCVKRK